MTEDKIIYISGMLIPLCYMLLYMIGGALRSDYNHISDSVSELLTSGAPNKGILTAIQIIYAALHVIFGFGVLNFVNEWQESTITGHFGAWSIIVLGLITFGTVIFPQDEKGKPETKAGRLHKILVFGGLIPFSILSTLLIGIWTKQAGILPGFAVYSYVTVGATAIMGVVGGLTVETRFTGLVERIAAIVTQQWLFILGLRLFLF